MSNSTPQSQPGVLPPPGDGYRVHAKQQAAIESDARYKTLKWGRRAGKNVVSVIQLIEFLRDPSSSRWGRDDPQGTPSDQPITVWWIGPSYDQAKQYGYEKVKAGVPNSWISSQSRSEPYRIEFINNTVAEFRTFAHPDTLQGAGVDGMIIDERDYMPDSIWYDDLEPMLMDFMGWTLWISKPVRPRSVFNQWFEYGASADYPEFYSSHATSADNPFIAEDPSDKQGTVPDHVYQQQYLAQLPDDGGQVFTHLDTRLFTGAYDFMGSIIEGIGEVQRDPGECTGPFSVGVDFARHRDYRVTMVLDAEGRIVFYSRDQNEGWDTIESDIVRVHETYPGVVVPDASRDNKIIPDLAQAGVRVKPFKFTKQSKKSIIEDLITRLENGEITAPDTPVLDQLGLELRAMEREVTESGYTSYHAPEGMHDDTVDALALAATELDRLGAVRARQDRTTGEPRGVSYL